MEPLQILWLVLFVVFLFIEAVTPQLVCIWFALGSLVALIVSFCGGEFWVQALVMIVSSAVLLAVTRPLYRKYFQSRQVATNTEALIGKTAPVTVEINNLMETGEVRLNGLSWSARSSSNDIIPVGSVVRVDAISGVKLMVTPIESSNVQDPTA